MMNSLLTKFYNRYAIIYTQHSPKQIYIKHYNIIRASHGQLTIVHKGKFENPQFEILDYDNMSRTLYNLTYDELITNNFL